MCKTISDLNVFHPICIRFISKTTYKLLFSIIFLRLTRKILSSKRCHGKRHRSDFDSVCGCFLSRKKNNNNNPVLVLHHYSLYIIHIIISYSYARRIKSPGTWHVTVRQSGSQVTMLARCWKYHLSGITLQRWPQKVQIWQRKLPYHKSSRSLDIYLKAVSNSLAVLAKK